ncbi:MULTISPECIES: hypothetical protein [Rhizobium]|uniref:hypothetical protein n=1 Tax=Rhizobium TaxID=379 RepID=UPI000F4FF67F|nr:MULTISPECIES: hypothetical protein [Rhizobium]
MTKAWWDDVPYSEGEKQPFAMQVECEPRFNNPCGFVKLKERHRVKAKPSITNADDRRCRIKRVKLK